MQNISQPILVYKFARHVSGEDASITILTLLQLSYFLLCLEI
jgi:hypothetical protein